MLAALGVDLAAPPERTRGDELDVGREFGSDQAVAAAPRNRKRSRGGSTAVPAVEHVVDAAAS
jgi:hypothetical protein